jgi:hypothetical protein
VTNQRRDPALLRIGITDLASVSIGILDYKMMLPVALVFMATAWIAFAILLFGKRFIPEVKYVEESGAVILPH